MFWFLFHAWHFSLLVSQNWCNHHTAAVTTTTTFSTSTTTSTTAGRGSSIGCTSEWYADGREFDPYVRQNIFSLRFGHEIISTTILPLPLIQEGQLSVTGERMDT